MASPEEIRAASAQLRESMKDSTDPLNIDINDFKNVLPLQVPTIKTDQIKGK